VKGAKPALKGVSWPKFTKGVKPHLLASSVVTQSPDFAGVAQTEFPWYAVRTRSHFERTAATVLAGKGYAQYLPMYREKKRWSDRSVITELPLFPGYIFCRFDSKKRAPILSTPGVFAIVGFGTEAAPIPDEEIEAIERVLVSGLAAKPCPFLHEGRRIRVEHGSLKGVEGILVRKKSDWRLVVSVDMLQRSVSVELDSDCISSL
jgi:transcription antitermination factor NusG